MKKQDNISRKKTRKDYPVVLSKLGKLLSLKNIKCLICNKGKGYILLRFSPFRIVMRCNRSTLPCCAHFQDKGSVYFEAQTYFCILCRQCSPAERMQNEN